MDAYSDASLTADGHHAALAALLTGTGAHVTRLVRVTDLQQAELLAAREAVLLTPAGTPLTLHADCMHTVQALRHPELAGEHMTLAFDILSHARHRDVTLTVRHIERQLNRAHDLAHQAAQRDPTRPARTGRVRLQTRLDGSVSAQGAGLNLTVRAGAQGMIDALIDLSRFVPAGETLELRGVTLYARTLWLHPKEAASTELARRVRVARQAMEARGAFFTFRSAH